MATCRQTDFKDTFGSGYSIYYTSLHGFISKIWSSLWDPCYFCPSWHISNGLLFGWSLEIQISSALCGASHADRGLSPCHTAQFQFPLCFVLVAFINRVAAAPCLVWGSSTCQQHGWVTSEQRSNTTQRVFSGTREITQTWNRAGEIPLYVSIALRGCVLLYLMWCLILL